MTENEIVELFKKHWNNSNNFEDIPEKKRLHTNQKLCGYLKIASMLKDPSEINFRNDGDNIYLAHYQHLDDSITEEDIIYLVRCGIDWQEDLHRFWDLS